MRAVSASHWARCATDQPSVVERWRLAICSGGSVPYPESEPFPRNWTIASLRSFLPAVKMRRKESGCTERIRKGFLSASGRLSGPSSATRVSLSAKKVERK